MTITKQPCLCSTTLTAKHNPQPDTSRHPTSNHVNSHHATSPHVNSNPATSPHVTATPRHLTSHHALYTPDGHSYRQPCTHLRATRTSPVHTRGALTSGDQCTLPAPALYTACWGWGRMRRPMRRGSGGGEVGAAGGGYVLDTGQQTGGPGRRL